LSTCFQVEVIHVRALYNESNKDPSSPRAKERQDWVTWLKTFRKLNPEKASKIDGTLSVEPFAQEQGGEKLFLKPTWYATQCEPIDRHSFLYAFKGTLATAQGWVTTWRSKALRKCLYAVSSLVFACNTLLMGCLLVATSWNWSTIAVVIVALSVMSRPLLCMGTICTE
jgi:hypothetical protein